MDEKTNQSRSNIYMEELNGRRNHIIRGNIEK